MSKIRTYEDFFDSLQEELAWRRKEILTLSMQIAKTQGELQNTLIRASIPLIYAHWEGFVKITAENYLKYLAYIMQSRASDFPNLRPHLVGLILWGSYKKKGLDERPTPKKYIDSIKECFDGISEIKIPYSKIVNTESNLNYKVLCDICSLIDIDSKIFQLKQKLIDEDLLKSRNYIAHGAKVSISHKEYVLIKDQILELLELFSNQLDNHIVQEKYTAT